MRAPEVALEIPEKLLPVLQPKRFKIMHGGRGGGKSHTVAQVLPAIGLQRSIRVLCVREVQKSLKDSSMQVLCDYIRRMGLEPYYDILKTEIRSKINGTTFSFAGLKDHTADSIKSWEGVDVVWVEEAHSVTPHSWRILIPTIRKPDSEIWATFNPDQIDDYVYDRFVVHTDPDAWVCQINWRDNPWFPSVLDSERIKLKEINTDLYEHVWEGKPRSLSGLLFKRRWFERFSLADAPRRLVKYISTDYAGGPDPDDETGDPDYTEHGVWGVDDRGDLWALDWWYGQASTEDAIAAWLELIQKHKPSRAFDEKGPILRSINGRIVESLRRSRVHVYRESLASVASKMDRALGFAARCQAGTVHVPNTPWGDRLVNQLCAFDGRDGKHDDAVDVCSLLGRALNQLRDARPEPAPEDRGIKPFTREWLYARDQRESVRHF